MAPPGSGTDLAWRLASGMDDPDLFTGQTAQAVAVDINDTVRSLEILATDEARRREMSEPAHMRAKALFDWSAVIGSYEKL